MTIASLLENLNPKRGIADKLGVDRTWFIGNFQARDLKSGDSWFGYELDAADLRHWA